MFTQTHTHIYKSVLPQSFLCFTHWKKCRQNNFILYICVFGVQCISHGYCAIASSVLIFWDELHRIHFKCFGNSKKWYSIWNMRWAHRLNYIVHFSSHPYILLAAKMLFWWLTFIINILMNTYAHIEYNTKTFALSIGQFARLVVISFLFIYLFSFSFVIPSLFGVLLWVDWVRLVEISNAIHNQAMNSQVSLCLWHPGRNFEHEQNILKTAFALAKSFCASEWANANGCAMKIAFARDYRLTSDKN